MQKKAGASPSGNPIATPSRNVPGVRRSFFVLSCHSSRKAMSLPLCTDRTVNARAVGSTLAGLLGGPVLGMLVGATAGVHRVTALSGVAALPGAISTTFEGLLAGVVHLALKHRFERLMTPWVALATTFVGEVIHMFIV